MQRWDEPRQVLDTASFEALLAGDVPAVHVEGFATDAECAALCAAMRGGDAGARAATTSEMELVGSNLSNAVLRGKAAYFESVPAARAVLERITRESFDATGRLVERLARIWPGPVAIAEEPQPYGAYFAGCIKSRVAGSAAHYDFAPHLLDGYAISSLTHQLAWNLYLEMPHGTGSTTVYEGMVLEPPPPVREHWSNLVPPEALAGRASYTFTPCRGELVVFNARCPHTVEMHEGGSYGRRTQIGSFIGRMPDDRLVLWS